MLNFEERDGITVVRLPADDDAANAETVSAEIMARASNQTPAMVIALSTTRYLDSAGIDMLFRLYERLQMRRQRMALVVPEDSPLLRELPEVMRREEPGTRHRDVPTVSNGRVELRGDSYVV